MSKRVGRGKQGPEDMNEIAFRVIQEATGQRPKGKKPGEPTPGRAGGLKGGRVRASRLTAAQRSEIARVAALARWKKAGR
jgi:hypothetical protein